jgi:hypothetical protein
MNQIESNLTHQDGVYGQGSLYMNQIESNLTHQDVDDKVERQLRSVQLDSSAVTRVLIRKFPGDGRSFLNG